MGITFADALVFGCGCTAKFFGDLLGSSTMGDDELCISQALQLKCYSSSARIHIPVRIECPAGHSGVHPVLTISLYTEVTPFPFQDLPVKVMV